VKLLQNQSLEASHLSFFNLCLKNVLTIFWKNFLGDSTFSSSLNANPGSAINFTTETKRCRQRRFPILLVMIDLTGWFCISSSQWLIISTTKCNRGIYMFHWILVAPQALKSALPVEDSISNKEAHLVISAHISL